MDDLIERFRQMVTRLPGSSPGGSVELLLQQMEPISARLLRLCAIPDQFNPAILQALDLSLDAAQAERHYREFSNLSIITPGEDGLSMHEDVRRYLFAQWIGPPTNAEFTDASARLVGYFEQRAQQVEGAQRETIQVRRMFHLIGADQDRGFAEFERLIHQKLDEFRLNDCRSLIKLVHEYDHILSSEHAERLAKYEENLTTHRLLQESERLIFRRQHDQSIALLEQACRLEPDELKLTRQLALTYGGKGELTMNRADQLRVRPPDVLLAETEALFRKAIETDPTLPDPYWDIAVLKARFQNDFQEAQRYLEEALQLGYEHRMLSALAQMIQWGLAGMEVPATLPSYTEGETELRRLILQLIEHPTIPVAEVFEPVESSEVFTPGDPIFNSYCRKAINLIRSGQVDLEIFQQIRRDCRNLQGDDTDYATDLLHVMSAEFHDPAVQKDATDEHLRILAEMSFALRSWINEDPENLRHARRAARRGLRIVAQSGVPVDPDVHADLLLALGQTFSHLSDYHLGEAVLHFLQALDLKEAANNLDDVGRLKDLLRQIISYQVGRSHIAPSLPLAGGLGEGLHDLEIAYRAAQRLADDTLIGDVGLALSLIYRTVQQPSEAETVLRQVLALPALSDRQQVEAKFELASALSEQHRPAEAEEIQEALLADTNAVTEPASRASLWMNLGNSRREMGDLSGAREAFKTALKTLPEPEPNVVRTQEGAILALLGQLEFLEGRPEAGQKYFEQAEELFSLLMGIEALQFHSLAVRCYFNAGMRDRALSHLDKARYVLRSTLEKGPSPLAWESMLQQWSYLDAYDVEIQLGLGTPEALETALISAESAKGRLLTWLRWHSVRQAAELALSVERHKTALTRVRTWVAERADRRVVALFAAPRGLAVFGIGPGSALTGRWLDDFQYDTFQTDYYTLWESQIDDALAGRSGAWELASALTEFLFDRVGEWLWRALPDLADGGEDLILIPHRLFRSLPLTHCRLPGGRRLSELFRRVVLSPSLFDLAESLDEADSDPPSALRLTALVDADGSLPFARLEGFAVAGVAATRTQIAVTVNAVRDALSEPGVVLLSCHGDFCEDNPWQSVIMTAKGAFTIHELLTHSLHARANLIVLGVCEAGRTRRSVSDEPLGFPGLFVQSGVRTAVAPIWKVDDFASLLFLTQFFARLRAGASAVEAVSATAVWLRELKPTQALEYVSRLVRDIEALRKNESAEALSCVRDRLQKTEGWLRGLPTKACPFRSPLDWAAFQVTGMPG